MWNPLSWIYNYFWPEETDNTETEDENALQTDEQKKDQVFQELYATTRVSKPNQLGCPDFNFQELYGTKRITKSKTETDFMKTVFEHEVHVDKFEEKLKNALVKINVVNGLMSNLNQQKDGSKYARYAEKKKKINDELKMHQEKVALLKASLKLLNDAKLNAETLKLVNDNNKIINELQLEIDDDLSNMNELELCILNNRSTMSAEDLSKKQSNSQKSGAWSSMEKSKSEPTPTPTQTQSVVEKKCEFEEQ